MTTRDRTIGFHAKRAAKAGPDRTIVVESSAARSLADWSPTLLKAARASAASGNLTQAADFVETAMADDRVLAALGTRTNGLVALPISFEPARGMKRLVKALEAGEDWWASYPATALAELLRWGIMLGVGLAEQVWTDRGSAINRVIPVLKIWNPRYLRRDIANRKWLLKIEGDKEIEIAPGDGKWILYMPYGDNRPWDRGAWRAISAWSLLKRYAIEDWARYSERHGLGTNVVTGPESVNKDKRKELADALRTLNGEGVVVLPSGFDYKLVEATANTWQTFEAQKNAADMGVSIAILGQNLSTEVSGPVSTGATLHGRVLKTYVDNDAETLTTCIHDQSLVWWAEFNFAARDAAPWPVYDTRPPEDRAANAAVLVQVATALNTLSLAGAPVDVRALLEQFKVPLKDAKDIEQEGQVFKYHLDYGVLTINEIRERLGLPKRSGGDVAPTPVAPPAAGDEGAKAWNTTLAALSRTLTESMADIEVRFKHLEGESSTFAQRTLEGLERLRGEVFRVREDSSHDIEQVRARATSFMTTITTVVDGVRAVSDASAMRLTQIGDQMAAFATRADVTALRDYTANTVTRIDAKVDGVAARLDDGTTIRLRSGRSVPVSSGLVQGQLYTDAVIDRARDRAAEVLDDDVAAVLDAVEAGTSYEDIRKRLVKTFKGMSPTKLAQLTEAALTMVELGGRHAVNEDTDG